MSVPRTAPALRPAALAACLAAWLAQPGMAAAQAVIPAPDGALPCLMDASARLKIGAPVTGLIDKVLVDRGDRVKAGDVIARLESSLEAAQVALAAARARNDTAAVSARTQLDYLRRKADRLGQLRASRSVTESSYDEVETEARVAVDKLRDAERNLEMAQLELERAQVQLQQREVRAPVDGIVTERNLSGGEYRFDQAHIVTLARVDPLYVEVFVPIALFGRARLGVEADIYPEEPIGGRYRARVIVVDKLVDAASGTFGVRLALPNPDSTLPAGLRCRLTFDDQPKLGEARMDEGAGARGRTATP